MVKSSVSFLIGFSLIDSTKGANCVCDRATVVLYQETGSCSPLIVYESITSIVNSCLSSCVSFVRVYLNVSKTVFPPNLFTFFSKEKGATKSNSRTNTESNSTTKNQGEFSSRYVAMHSDIVVNFSCDPGSGVGSGQTRFILNDADNAFLNRFFQVKL